MYQSNNDDLQTAEPKARSLGGTELSCCKAVPGGTGITVLALHLSKPPNLTHLQTSIHHLQATHSILRSKLHFSASTNTFSFLTPPLCPNFQIQLFDLSSTSTILVDNSVTPFHHILEHEMNKNSWAPNPPNDTELHDVFFASVYTLSEAEWVVVLRLHTGACDRAAAAYLLRELMELMSGKCDKELVENDMGIGMKIEDCIPNGKGNKPFWARGMDMVGYSLNSFRLANLNFVDTESTRRSQMVRLHLNPNQAHRLLEGCKSEEIKLYAAIAAAGLIAAHSSKHLPNNQRQEYGVVTLIDCRSILDPVVNINHLGFYHSAIMNSHDISGNDKLWEVANRCYLSVTNAKKNNKHFTDMGGLNFLIGKAIDNPGLTPSGALRTACISVFEDPVIDDSNASHEVVGVEDYVGCASVHGVGPSIAVLDTIRDGQLDCACLYPSPLHSREQMQKLIQDMKTILVDCCVNEDEDVKEES